MTIVNTSSFKLPYLSIENIFLQPEIKQENINVFKDLSMIIMKVTSRCNLRCVYCYEHLHNAPEMSSETFKIILEELVRNSKQQKITVLFHGGEPSLLSIDWYEKAINVISQVKQTYNKTIKLAMQTNLVNLTEEQIRFYATNQIRLSASFDGLPAVNNKSRGGSNRIIDNIKVAVDSNILGSVLTVINQSNWDHLSLFSKWLFSEFKISHLKANSAYPVGHYFEHQPLTSEQLFSAWKDLVEYMIETGGTELVEENLKIQLIRYFSDSINNSGGPGVCNKWMCGAGRQVVAVSPSGEILPCGRFVWSDPVWSFGNIHSQPVDTNLHENVMKRFENIAPHNWIECNKCEAKKICNFGCRAFVQRSKIPLNIECSPTKMLYKYFSDNSHRLRGLYEQLTNQKSSLLTAKDDFWSDYSDYSDSYSDSYSD